MEKIYRKVGKRYVEINPQLTLNQELVLGSAMRYALGRKTYVVGSVCEELVRLEPLLNWNFKERVAKEIQKYQDEYGEAGMSFDNDEWNYVKWLYTKDKRYVVEANKYLTDEWFEVECFLGEDGNFYPLGENINKSHLHTTRNEQKQ